jgi:hypothetical protein
MASGNHVQSKLVDVMNNVLKRRIVHALVMGGLTTGIISFGIISFNMGFFPGFVAAWLLAWVMAYAIVVPTLLLVGPWVQERVNRLFP